MLNDSANWAGHDTRDVGVRDSEYFTKKKLTKISLAGGSFHPLNWAGHEKKWMSLNMFPASNRIVLLINVQTIDGGCRLKCSVRVSPYSYVTVSTTRPGEKTNDHNGVKLNYYRRKQTIPQTTYCFCSNTKTGYHSTVLKKQKGI